MTPIQAIQQTLQKAFNVLSEHHNDGVDACSDDAPITQEETIDDSFRDSWDVDKVFWALFDEQKSSMCPILKSLWLMGDSTDSVVMATACYENGYKQQPNTSEQISPLVLPAVGHVSSFKRNTSCYAV